MKEVQPIRKLAFKLLGVNGVNWGFAMTENKQEQDNVFTKMEPNLQTQVYVPTIHLNTPSIVTSQKLYQLGLSIQVSNKLQLVAYQM